MSNLILIINLVILYLAVRKHMLVYALLSGYFLFLVVGQSMQIDADLESVASVTYLYAFMTKSAFEQSESLLLGVSLLSLLLVLIAPGFPSQKDLLPTRIFAPSKVVYFFLLLFLLGLAGILIFVVVGFPVFLNSSRPGFESGSTIILTFLAFGIYPLLLKLMYRCKLHLGDWSCAAITLLVSMGFSRMHVIAYLTSCGVTYYYNSDWVHKAVRLKHMIIALGSVAFAVGLFMTIGAIRDAQNHEGGSVSSLIRYNLDHPTDNMLSLAVTYRRSVEGMSALAGAVTVAEAHPESVRHDFGLRWIVGGLMVAMPGQMKAKMKSFDDALQSLNWYSDPIIASGIAQFYQSFGWIAMLLYPVVFFLFAWPSIAVLARMQLAPAFRLCFYLMTGFCIFFVRGTIQGWIGYSLANCATILATAPIWTLWVVPRAEATSICDANTATGTAGRSGFAHLP